ncbi:hypothetical protein ACFPRL_34855 [Pseudoclavibacter helvolus]
MASAPPARQTAGRRACRRGRSRSCAAARARSTSPGSQSARKPSVLPLS